MDNKILQFLCPVCNHQIELPVTTGAIVCSVCSAEIRIDHERDDGRRREAAKGARDEQSGKSENN